MKFNCIVIDPPWSYNNKRTGGSFVSGSEQHYDTLTVDELMDLKPYIDQITKDDCVIYLWVTNSFLREGLDLLEHYGFDYHTLLTWVKSSGNSKGLGYWYRGNTEHIMLGSKGNMPAFRCQEVNVFHSPTKGHSIKPAKSYELIEKATKVIPNLRILEIFARRYRKNWITIGYELDGLDIRDSLKRVYKS